MRLLVIGPSAGFTYEDYEAALKMCGWKPTSILKTEWRRKQGIENTVLRQAMSKDIEIYYCDPVVLGLDISSGSMQGLYINHSISLCHGMIIFWDEDNSRSSDIFNRAKAQGIPIFIYLKEEEEDEVPV